MGPADFYQNRGPAHIERVVWKIIPENSTRLASVMTNQVQLTQYVPQIALAQALKAPNLKVVMAESYLWTYYIGFKIDRELMSDIRVRQAINLGVDQQALVKNVWFGHAVPAYSRSAPTPRLQPENARRRPEVRPAGQEAARRGGLEGRSGRLPLQGRQEAGAGLLRHLGRADEPDGRGRAGRPAQDRHRHAGETVRCHLAWGKLGTQEFDSFAMSFPI